MRLKLTRNYSFTDHTDASRARDNITDEVDARVASVPVRVAKEAVVQNVDEDILEVDDVGSPGGNATKERVRAISETEKSVLGKIMSFLQKFCQNCLVAQQGKCFYLCISQFQLRPSPPPPGQLRGICTHCQSQGWGISLPKGSPGLLTHTWFLTRDPNVDDFVGKDQ